MAKKKKTIPRLDHEDLYKTFGVEEKSPSFSEELDDNLAGQDLNRIAIEKAAAFHKPQTKKEKLKKYPPPQEELDLHRLTGPEAVRKTVDFLKASKTFKLRTVRIITGKGLHSDGPAILPDLVETKLTEFKSANLIFDFCWEKKEKLKSGSVIIYL